MKDPSPPIHAYTRSPPWSVYSNVNFSIPTEISISGVPGGGRARFARGPAFTGVQVYAVPLLAAADFVAAMSPACVSATESPMLFLAGAADLDALVAHFSFTPGGGTESANVVTEVREKVWWFVDRVRSGKDGRGGVGGDLIAAHSLHFNHSVESCNLRPTVEDGYFMIHAVRDISSGDELFFDYNVFEISEEAQGWFKQHGLRDTKGMVQEWQKVSA